MSISVDERKIKKLHSRNRHLSPYNFEKLCYVYPAFKKYVKLSKLTKELTINFSDKDAVRALNKALLKTYYDIKYWELSNNNLCPPIPGRADYIHYIADVLAENNEKKIPIGNNIKILDIGVGANCIYPIIGSYDYGWCFVGSELDPISFKNAQKIIKNNSRLHSKVDIKMQYNSNHIFKNIVDKDDKFDISICNPPFFKSKQEVIEQTTRKLKNLGNKIEGKIKQNFGGNDSELWCRGGERLFITKMIKESKEYKNQVKCFSTLVSKKENLRILETLLKKEEVNNYRVVNMKQGNKISRILVWSF